jgi:AbiV family abortive infection protein
VSGGDEEDALDGSFSTYAQHRGTPKHAVMDNASIRWRMAITSDLLAHGAVLAGEQAGILFHDAVILFRADSFSTCVALCALSREETGRAMMLLQYRELALAGQTITAKELIVRTKNHPEKLEFGMPYVPLINDPPKRKLRELREEELGRPLYTQEDREYFSRLEEHLRDTRSSIAKTDHARKLDALYLNLDPQNEVWLRPCRTGRDEALSDLHRTAVDYAFLFYDLTCPKGAELNAVLSQWAERPQLPEPIYVDDCEPAPSCDN